ncbi:rubredoxin-like domain-containing protein [Clostridioides difficile]
MKKFVCTVCGYIHEGDAAPAQCPDGRNFRYRI